MGGLGGRPRMSPTGCPRGCYPPPGALHRLSDDVDVCRCVTPLAVQRIAASGAWEATRPGLTRQAVRLPDAGQTSDPRAGKHWHTRGHSGVRARNNARERRFRREGWSGRCRDRRRGDRLRGRCGRPGGTGHLWCLAGTRTRDKSMVTDEQDTYKQEGKDQACSCPQSGGMAFSRR